MSRCRVEVAAVRGTCNAGLVKGDRLDVDLDRLDLPEWRERSCCLAFASIVAGIGRLKLQPDPLFVACPDPGTGAGGNVIFELSLVDGHEDDQR
jgi:uncharacterized repeat protein (TIGR04076 family)